MGCGRLEQNRTGLFFGESWPVQRVKFCPGGMILTRPATSLTLNNTSSQSEYYLLVGFINKKIAVLVQKLGENVLLIFINGLNKHVV